MSDGTGPPGVSAPIRRGEPEAWRSHGGNPSDLSVPPPCPRVSAVKVRAGGRGFATILAVFLVGLVVAGMAVTVAGLATQGRRTRAAVVDAQLRQLLLAGGADVVARSDTWPADPRGVWTMGVPADLAGLTVGVGVTSTGAGSAEAVVTARGDGRRAVQRMVWRRADARWQLAAVTLDGG